MNRFLQLTQSSPVSASYRGILAELNAKACQNGVLTSLKKKGREMPLLALPGDFIEGEFEEVSAEKCASAPSSKQKYADSQSSASLFESHLLNIYI